MHAHLNAEPDGISELSPVLERYPDFLHLIALGEDAGPFERLRRAVTVGRPLGDDEFLLRLEALTLLKGPQPPPKAASKG